MHFVVEPKSRWFFEPRVYYEAVAITANITIYDHRQEREERQRARLKSLLLFGGFATVLLLMLLHAARNGTGQRASEPADHPTGLSRPGRIPHPEPFMAMPAPPYTFTQANTAFPEPSRHGTMRS